MCHMFSAQGKHRRRGAPLHRTCKGVSVTQCMSDMVTSCCPVAGQEEDTHATMVAEQMGDVDGEPIGQETGCRMEPELEQSR